jgi:hypothetical protein
MELKAELFTDEPSTPPIDLSSIRSAPCGKAATGSIIFILSCVNIIDSRYRPIDVHSHKNESH